MIEAYQTLVDANLLAGPCRHYLLTSPREFGILQSGPGWRGAECNSIE